MADKNAGLDNELILFASTASQLLAEKKVDEALSLCETGVREFPFYAPGHYILGLCYDELGKVEDAKNEFERVLVYDPSHNTAMHRLADIYTRSGLEQVANEIALLVEHLDTISAPVAHVDIAIPGQAQAVG